MSDNVLKKQFQQKDVQRLRNLMTGKHGAKTTVGVGYTKQQEFHEEGDVWEEDDRTWTIKNGIKQNITKLDKAKESIHVPLFCPCCNNLMKNKHDKAFYLQYKRCFNCQAEFETELRIKGLWEDYEKHILNSDIDAMINEFSIWIDEQMDETNTSYITEAGDVERWVGSSKRNY